ncbi:hypothetical protein [Fusobacterium varium]|uniref:hypothetical protein n=1 Tax=Fusobacterium varium TaxID=856 RepID=UPI003030E0D3
MKKLFKILVILSIAISFISCGREVTPWEAKEALSKHLIERYGEEFEIGYMGRRSDGKEVWYEAEIYPSKYVGTVKEYDKYYRESGTVNIEKGILGEKLGKAGDTYGIVKVNESAEKFYEKKLKELFGDNILQVYDIWFNRILDDYSFENIIRVSDEERTALIIKGGIYIFGRVESDEDREWYRKQIYEFIQFMKETGTFEYVALDINILDIRILKDEIFTNKEISLQLKENRKKLQKREFFDYRNKLYGSYLEKNENFSKKLSILNKSELENNISEEMYQSIIFYKRLYSAKYIESNHLENKVKREYNSLNEFDFDWEKF